jgi:hypothetical protein
MADWCTFLCTFGHFCWHTEICRRSICQMGNINKTSFLFSVPVVGDVVIDYVIYFRACINFLSFQHWRLTPRYGGNDIPFFRIDRKRKLRSVYRLYIVDCQFCLGPPTTVHLITAPAIVKWLY